MTRNILWSLFVWELLLLLLLLFHLVLWHTPGTVRSTNVSKNESSDVVAATVYVVSKMLEFTVGQGLESLWKQRRSLKVLKKSWNLDLRCLKTRLLKCMHRFVLLPVTWLFCEYKNQVFNIVLSHLQQLGRVKGWISVTNTQGFCLVHGSNSSQMLFLMSSSGRMPAEIEPRLSEHLNHWAMVTS